VIRAIVITIVSHDADELPDICEVSAGAGTLRRVTVQLAAILAGREIEPAPAGAKEAALVSKAQQIRRLSERKLEPTEILLGWLAHPALFLFNGIGASIELVERFLDALGGPEAIIFAVAALSSVNAGTA